MSSPDDDPEVRELMKDEEMLIQIVKELIETFNNNITVDWDIKRSLKHVCACKLNVCLSNTITRQTKVQKSSIQL